jgi:hypothetical protein
MRIEVWLHVCGYTLCVLGLVNEPALACGILLLARAYICTLLKWQGDKFAVWPVQKVPSAGCRI